MGNTIRLCLIQLPDHQGPILPSLSGSSNASSGTLSDGDPDSTTPRKQPPQQQQHHHHHHLQRRLLSSKFLQSFKKTRRSFKARKRNNNHHDADEVCYDYYDYHYDDEEERERGLDSPVWQRTILMGERCEPPEFSGVILYDAQGNRVPEYPRSPLHKTYWSPSIRTTQLQHSS